MEELHVKIQADEAPAPSNDGSDLTESHENCTLYESWLLCTASWGQELARGGSGLTKGLGYGVANKTKPWLCTFPHRFH